MVTENETDKEYINDLSPLQNKAIRVLLTRGNIKQTLQITGVSRVTLYRWLTNDESFRAVLKHHTQVILDSTTRSLCMAAEDSVRVLTTAVNDTSLPMAQRLRAADMVLNHMVRLVALTDMENRLAALEQLEGTINVQSENPHKAFRETTGRAA